MSIFVPFNHQPSSVSVKTSSYTVPAGSYARVIVIDTSDNFTIDAVTAIEATHYVGSSSSFTQGNKFTNNSPYILEGTVWFDGLAGSGVVRIVTANNNSNEDKTFESGGGGTTNITSSKYSAHVKLSVGDIIRVQTATGSGVNVRWNLNAISPNNVNTEFWVPTGTDLDGTRYIVELYDELDA